MDVGQVKFSIIADGLDATLSKATQLQDILNGMDGKTYGKGGGGTNNLLRTKNKARRLAANIEKKYAEQEHAHKVKLDKDHQSRRFKFLKDQAKLEADIAKREHAEKVKRENDWQKRQADFKREDAKLEAKLAAKQHNDKVAQEKKDRQHTITEGKKLAKQYWKDAEEAARAPYEYQQKWETALARQGARLQTLGATIQNITEPFANVYRGLAMGVGYKLLGTVQNSIEGAMSRFDTRNLYKKMMEEYSSANYSTAQSWSELDQSVIGLPTSVAEIAEMAQRYTLSLGNMERGTRLAIASNRAFLASMATDTQKYQGMLQLQDLMNGKELQPREWMSLGSSMGKAINEIAKVMGAKTQEDIRKFRQELYAGKVNTEDFLDALEKVGNKGGKIYKMAEEYKDTIEALRKNVGNAFQRMGEHLLMALDDIFESATGKGLVKNLLGITKAIDDMSASAQEWIKSNPDVIMDFFNDLKSIDWKGMISGFAQFGLTMGKIYTGLLKTFGGKGLIYAMLYGNLAGKGIQLAGGLEKGLAEPISKLMTLFKFGASGKAIKGAKDLAKNHGVLVSATQAVSGMALSWQDVASKAVSVAAIPALAGSLVLVAKALQEFSKVDVDWAGLTAKLGMAAEAMLAFGTMATVLGGLMTTNVAGWITTAGVAAGTAMIAGISGAMIAAAKGLNDISKAEIPDSAKVAEVVDAIEKIGVAFEARNPFEALGRMFDAWSKGAEFGTVEKITSALQSLQRLGSLTLSTESLNAAKANFKTMGDFINDMENWINGGQDMGTSQGAIWRRNTSLVSGWKIHIDDFAQQMSGIASSLTSLQSAVNQLQNISKVDQKVINLDAISNLATTVDTALASLEAVGVRNVEIAINITSKITGADEVIEAVQKEIDKIEKAIKGMDDHFDKKIYVHLQSAGVFGGFGIVDAVRQRINAIRSRVASLNGNITKSISVSTSTSGIGGGGGGGWQHGGIVYRAGGGRLSRGTDIVPAMLTPGEFVLKQRAASMLGHALLNRLNHLDIRGAISELSARASQRSSMVSTVNNTKNISLTMNNNNSPGIGLSKTSGWLNRL